MPKINFDNQIAHANGFAMAPRGRFMGVILRGYATCGHLKALRLSAQLERNDEIPSVAEQAPKWRASS